MKKRIFSFPFWRIFHAVSSNQGFASFHLLLFFAIRNIKYFLCSFLISCLYRALQISYVWRCCISVFSSSRRQALVFRVGTLVPAFLYTIVPSLLSKGSAQTPWIRSYKKDDEPLLILTGAMSSSREKVLLCTENTGVLLCTRWTKVLLCTRWTKQGVGGKVYNQGKCGKLIEQLLSTFSAPSQAPSLGWNYFMTMGSGSCYNLRLQLQTQLAGGREERKNPRKLARTDFNPPGWVKFSGKIKKGGVIIWDDNITW